MNASFRPPAVPLVTHDPYFSLWSFADRLTDDVSRHWTGAAQPMAGLLRVGEKTWRFCGPNRVGAACDLLPQTSLEVLPTRTICQFASEEVRLTLTFLTPALPEELDWLGRPVTYLVFDVSVPGATPQDVTLYWDVGGEIAVNLPEDCVTWGRLRTKNLEVLSMSSQEQRMLGRAGDNLRIEWGHAYLAIGRGEGSTFLGDRCEARDAFVAEGRLPVADSFSQPMKAEKPAMAAVMPLGLVGGAPVRRHLLLAYDDILSVEYLHRRLRPWWRRNGMEAAELLETTHAAFPQIFQRCEHYDAQLMTRFRERGGDDYARLCALSFRQCLAAHKLAADFDGSPVYLSKENFSNGCVATVDVTYPSSPFFLALNPALLKAQLDPVLAYASSSRWKFPFAPHDLGTYPLANGQAYGGGEQTEKDQMPVEECGNLLILVSAVALREGRPEYALKWAPLLKRWAGYLEEKGMDPENQLCTDDFAGHLAHNTNLSLKAIIALGAYAKITNLAGDAAEGRRLRGVAEAMAARWQTMADDGDHYRLAFDKPGTWSQKYNLVWDRLLGLNLFPAEVARKELAYYRTRQNIHGLPLDNRKDYTKLDWIFWTASLAETDEEFQALTAPAHRWVTEGVSRVPLTDWYETTGDGRHLYFQARSVVGGIFMRLLTPVIHRS